MHFLQSFRFLPAIIITVLFASCTPKVTAPVTTPATTSTTVSKPQKPGETLSPCDKFSDTPNPDQAETDYVIYRQLFKAKEMTQAMAQWRKVYAASPAADGRRSTVFTDGIAMYNDLIQKNPERKDAYGDTLLTIYAKARECYPGNGYMAAIQGFDSYYTYPGSATDEEMFDLFKESIEIDGQDKLQYFIINPTAGLAVNLHRDGKITDTEAKEVVSKLQYRLAKGLKECKGSECDPWNKIDAYAPSALRYFETVKGFYECQYFVDRYLQNYKDNPDDCDAITTAYSRLKFGGCATDSPEMTELKNAFTSKCRETPAPSAAAGTWVAKVRAGYDAMEAGNSSEAVRLISEAIPDIPEAEKKSRYQMVVAKIYYRDLRNFSQARSFARQAAQNDPTTGEPYMLIGTLYASSGPLCGSGTGFNSQVVTWPAIDMWQRAKSIDSSVAGKANKLINQYSRFMPSKADVFQRGLEVGGSYTVGCWINETTRIRTP
ncbi:M48 family metallopeptidase [Lewinella sp. 4G2]|uniref:tetratricopeptide repeat protein n=1 Tax=Lewinella sp. 4G2 TaxID=1803372 RepID=UPI0007B4BD70|nr:hypothetical protein [Lewinella sp. 4G2]OAV45723.1 hypothetical protein A3850_015020 [Lewinella sp. 4G2]